MNPITVHIEPLGRRHHREAFDCGEPALDAFFRRNARQNQGRGVSRTYVATPRHENDVLGFYTLASGAVGIEALPENERRRLPRYPVPVIQLARLAVDRRARERGVGKALLLDAMRRTMLVADVVGVFALEVYAKHDAAAAFYHHYGFAPFTDDRLHLYLPTSTIRTILDGP